MDNAISNGGTVFVHCQQGISRSSAMVILYLMWRNKKPFPEMHEFVKAKRPICNPNTNFTCQLLLWWTARTANPPVIRTFLVTQHRKDSFDTLVLREQEECTSVDPRGCYIICNRDKSIFIWYGNDSHQFLRKGTKHFVRLLQRFESFPNNITKEQQNNESDELKSFFPQIVNVCYDPKNDAHFELLLHLRKRPKLLRQRSGKRKSLDTSI